MSYTPTPIDWTPTRLARAKIGCMARRTVVKPGRTARQMLRDDLARARRIVRAVRRDLRERIDFMGGNLPAWELTRFVESERAANKDAAKLLAQLDKMA